MVFRLVSSSPPILCTSSWLNEAVPNVPSLPGFLDAALLTISSTLRANSRVLGICGTVDQKGPIDVTAGREFVTCQRAENDDAGVLRIDAPERVAELVALLLSTVARCGKVAPIRSESLLQLRQVRWRHFHRGCYHHALLQRAPLQIRVMAPPPVNEWSGYPWEATGPICYIRTPFSSSWTKKGRAMATTATTDTNAPRFRRLVRYSYAVHGYQGKVTAWTLIGPHLDLTESIVEECRQTVGV